MIDFSPLLKDPSMIFFGAAAQFGIFATFLLSLWLIPILLSITAPVTTAMLARAALFRERSQGGDVPAPPGGGSV